MTTRGRRAAAEVDQQAVERVELDPRLASPMRVADDRPALLEREQRLLAHVLRDRDDHLVEQRQRAPRMSTWPLVIGSKVPG